MRICISLPDALSERMATATHTNISAVCRAAIEAHLDGTDHTSRKLLEMEAEIKELRKRLSAIQQLSNI